ncbi:unnamed protein product [Symbiodinium pilosum]|uniref:Uncharacterized protein n=1 Tax=Symbiodinium pilosum TaxID=2952 RepID=A0A812UVW1_SYMPI|nr:unnamed protein product [Symbiodinium pilosum]
MPYTQQMDSLRLFHNSMISGGMRGRGKGVKGRPTGSYEEKLNYRNYDGEGANQWKDEKIRLAREKRNRYGEVSVAAALSRADGPLYTEHKQIDPQLGRPNQEDESTEEEQELSGDLQPGYMCAEEQSESRWREEETWQTWDQDHHNQWWSRAADGDDARAEEAWKERQERQLWERPQYTRPKTEAKVDFSHLLNRHLDQMLSLRQLLLGKLGLIAMHCKSSSKVKTRPR